MQKIKAKLPAAQSDAYFQLVEHPILALANLYRLYYYVAWNRRLADANDVRANTFAAQAEDAFKRDRQIANAYHALNGGKWDGMMLQSHIGYTTWQQPEKDVMPEVKQVGSAVSLKGVAYSPPVETSGEVGTHIEAAKFTKAHSAKGLDWRVIPHLGRGIGAVTAFPQGRPPTSREDAVYLEYNMNLEKAGDAAVQLHLLPTLNTSGGVDVRIGVSLDDGPMQTLAMRLTPSPDPGKTPEQKAWENAVIDNLHVLEAKFAGITTGKHTIKVWRIDDNALLTRLVVSQE